MNIGYAESAIFYSNVYTTVVSATYGIENAIDTTWILIAAFLVFFMNLGFAMLESGMQRAKNTSNICMKNLVTPAIGGLAFFIVGFSLAFGSDIFGFLGNPIELAMLGRLGALDIWPNTNVTSYAYFLFQVMFAATAATIVSGAVGERIKFIGYVLFTAIILTLVYPLVAHWVWGGGWLASIGMVDFAGSAVVHLTGGAAALAGAIVLGPRIGKYADGKINLIPGHNISLSTIGAMVLWFGWFGFNPGSTAAATIPSIATIAITTNIAAAAGALGAMVTAWIHIGKPDVGMTINGLLAGLVAITAGCASVSPGTAMAIGSIAGILVVFSVEFIDKVLRVDDPVGAISVHGVGGAFGALAVGIFAESSFSGGVSGLLFGGRTSQLAIQLVGVGSIFAFVFATSYLVFKAIDYTIGLRVSEEEEIIGLDIAEHGMSAYPDFEVPS
ncbi:MAG: ammonium transporter [Candidatus Methanomethyliaceae archaeon]|nr:ammonium transporter [Candidatus Methanomethyliaceae archaeon]